VAAAIPALVRRVGVIRRPGGLAPGPGWAIGLLLGVSLAASACQSTAPTRAPSAAPQAAPLLGLDWGRAASVERPANYTATVAPSYPGVHPILRIQGQANMSDVIALSGGGFAAVGYAPPDWVPVAWTSMDGSSWSFHALDPTPFTFPLALAGARDGSLVAVGRAGGQAATWSSNDGITWARGHVPALRNDGVPERMTSVAANRDRLVAGGSAGPELSEREARFWTSTDGRNWVPEVPDDPAAFANAEVRSITPFDGGFVAVGVVGDAQHQTAAVAWTSPDGLTWVRSDDPDFADGLAVSVIAAPFGGLVAVGSDVERRNAAAWTSRDGVSWTRAPDEASRQHSGGYAWLTDVAAIDGEVIAVGDIQGLQRGTAMAWRSTDGLHWERANRAPVQEGAEFYAIIPGGPGAIAVGAFGAPDSYVPEVWLSPSR
jgi:hypothetical protein